VLVADERDAPDGDRLVLDDLELDEDLVLALRHDFERDLGEEEALLGVEIADFLDAAADRGVAQDRVRLHLEPFEELLVVDLVVALELNFTDVRPLAHDEAQGDAVVASIEIDLDVVEEARIPELAH